MSEIFDTLIREEDRVISIVGGGGKTSLMFLLAHAFEEKGLRVVSTTTTRILLPTLQQSAGIVFTKDTKFQDILQKCLMQYGHATVADSLLSSGDKLQGISCTQVEQLLGQPFVERILVEADGARQLSLKAPGDNEPVVPNRTDLFISVVGLDSIGKRLEDRNVFRAGLVSSLTGLSMGDTITPLTVARLAVHPDGLLKGCPAKARSTVFLNKCDLAGGSEKALAVIEAAKELRGNQVDLWVSGSIRDNVCAVSGDLLSISDL